MIEQKLGPAVTLVVTVFLLTVFISGCGLVPETPAPPPPAESAPGEVVEPNTPPTVEPTTPIEAINATNAEQVQELSRWGRGQVDSAVYSPDGSLLAVASSIGIWLYAADTLEDVRFIDTGNSVWSVAFSPDGQVLASGSSDATVTLWQVAGP